jgi:hypothetical protein
VSDIIERAENLLADEWALPKTATAVCYIISELVTELKAARAQVERMRACR